MSNLDYLVMTDREFDSRYSMVDTVNAIEETFKSHYEGTLTAPSRFKVDVPDGSLVFTVGAETNRFNTMGFRVYETIPESPDDTQLVAVFESETGVFNGLIIGHRVGEVRTGAIGGVAVNHLAKQECSTLGIIGSGRQANTQLEAALAVRHFEHVKVYSPTTKHRHAFAERFSAEYNIAIDAVDTNKEAVDGVDVLIVATSSREPVLEGHWIEPGTHINTIGPKFEEIHELAPDISSHVDDIFTDSLAQVEAYTQSDLGFFLDDSFQNGDFIELSDVVAEDQSSAYHDRTTLFCSAGLAGTEVIVANQVLS